MTVQMNKQTNQPTQHITIPPCRDSNLYYWDEEENLTLELT